MKTFTLIGLSSVMILLSACAGGLDSGDAGTGTSSLGSSSDLPQTFPGGDCYAMDSNSCAAFKATNVQRVANGLAMMSYCQACYNMAAEQSKDMSVRDYFSHDRPDETFAHRVARFGLASGAGENLALGKLGAPVVDLWMNSPPHRANILNANFRSFAIGTYGGYTTQVFYYGTDK